MRAARLALMGLVLGWLLSCAAVSPVGAAEIEVKARAGFDQKVRSGHWTPVHATITNAGPDRQVTVRVQRTTNRGTMSVSQPIELPTGTRKEVTLLTLADGLPAPLAVEVVSGDQVLAQTRLDVTVVGRDVPLIGILASTPEDATRVIAGLGALGGERQAARLTPEELPANPHALLGLDALVINGASTRTLSPVQRTALADWVALGGTVVLGGGAGTAAVLEGLGDLSPVDPAGPAASVAKLPALETLGGAPIEAAGPFVVATVTPRPSAGVMAAEPGQPLVVTQSLGAGRVSYVAFDLGREPLLGWTGATRFWNNLIVPTPGSEATLLGMADRLRWALGSGTALDLPSAGGLALLLLGYIIVIGPINYVMLRRLDRREWAWITTPVITLLFTAGLFAVGAGTRGGQVAVNTMSVIYSASGAPQVSTESIVGVFSPGRANHTLQWPDGTLVSGVPDDSRGPDGPLPPLKVWQGSGTEIRDVPFAAAEFMAFVAQHTGGPPPLHTELNLQGLRLTGAVTNTSEVALRDTQLIIGSQRYDLGTIPPGETVAVDWQMPQQVGTRLGNPIVGRPVNRLPAQAGGPSEWQQQAQFQLLDVLYGLEGGAPVATGLEVIGWQDAAPLALAVSNTTVQQQAVTLVRHHAALTVQSGEVSLPPGFLPRSVSTTALSPFPKGMLVLPAGETVVSFSMPAALHGLSADELTLLVSTDPRGGMQLQPANPAGSSPAAPPRPAPGTQQQTPAQPRPLPAVRIGFALWDYQRGAWVDISHAGAGRTVIPNAAPYVQAAQPVRLRLTVPAASEPLMLSELDLGVRGSLR